MYKISSCAVPRRPDAELVSRWLFIQTWAITAIVPVSTRSHQHAGWVSLWKDLTNILLPEKPAGGLIAFNVNTSVGESS